MTEKSLIDQLIGSTIKEEHIEVTKLSALMAIGEQLQRLNVNLEKVIYTEEWGDKESFIQTYPKVHSNIDPGESA